MYLNYIANDAPLMGWKNVEYMLNSVAPKMLLLHIKQYKDSKILSVDSMKLDLEKRLNSRKVKDYKYEYYVHASHQGRQEFKGLARIEEVKKRADEQDKKRSEMRKPGFDPVN